MTQKQLERELRRVTGESRHTIGRLGFQLKPVSRIRRHPSKPVVNNPR